MQVAYYDHSLNLQYIHYLFFSGTISQLLRIPTIILKGKRTRRRSSSARKAPRSTMSPPRSPGPLTGKVYCQLYLFYVVLYSNHNVNEVVQLFLLLAFLYKKTYLNIEQLQSDFNDSSLKICSTSRSFPNIGEITS